MPVRESGSPSGQSTSRRQSSLVCHFSWAKTIVHNKANKRQNRSINAASTMKPNGSNFKKLLLLTTLLGVVQLRCPPKLAGIGVRELSTSTQEVARPISTDLVQQNDKIYRRDQQGWDNSPIVLEEYKLVFFSVPKVACTTFKQLFRRMMNHTDFMTQDWRLGLPHNPNKNGLKYLYDYSLEEANYMMTSPEYTRAIFVREPKARFMSSYMDKGVHNVRNFLERHCCSVDTPDCLDHRVQEIDGFIKLIQSCSNAHWDPQNQRMDSKFWDYINFIGHLETISEDGPRLLKRIGAEKYLEMEDWGRDRNAGVFTKPQNQKHTTNSARYSHRLTPDLARQVEHYYREDYENPLFGFKN